MQYDLLMFENPKLKWLSMDLLCFRDFTHTWCSTTWSQNSNRGHSSLKRRLHNPPQGSVHRAWEGVWEEPGKHLSLPFTSTCSNSDSSWQNKHGFCITVINSFEANNSFSHFFPCLLSPLILYPLSIIPPPHHVALFVWRENWAASCQVWHQLILI